MSNKIEDTIPLAEIIKSLQVDYDPYDIIATDLNLLNEIKVPNTPAGRHFAYEVIIRICVELPDIMAHPENKSRILKIDQKQNHSYSSRVPSPRKGS